MNDTTQDARERLKQAEAEIRSDQDRKSADTYAARMAEQLRNIAKLTAIENNLDPETITEYKAAELIEELQSRLSTCLEES